MKSPGKKNNLKRSVPRKKDEFLSALDFFAEAGLLKRIKRSGWWVAGIDDPETVAEHSFRTAVIAFYIAHVEGVDPYKTMTMALFNDIHEARINDLHKMGHYYIEFRDAEKKVFFDQVKDLHPKVKHSLGQMRSDYDAQLSQESIVARDADILECLVQAKEYYENGHTTAKKFFQIAPGHLKTKTAQQLWQKFMSWDSHDWWQSVVKFER
ncbi:MAG: HD domain-containing protein [Candidatus Omnitrophica bacterium]|nr:HD domain-containing protein [Candidatus Omnitrophota bacterium]